MQNDPRAKDRTIIKRKKKKKIFWDVFGCFAHFWSLSGHFGGPNLAGTVLVICIKDAFFRTYCNVSLRYFMELLKSTFII